MYKCVCWEIISFEKGPAMLRANHIALKLIVVVLILVAGESSAKQAKPSAMDQNQSDSAGQVSQEKKDSSADAGQDGNTAFKKIQALNWQMPPKTASIGSEATITLSEDIAFIGSDDTNKFLQLTDNLPCSGCYTLAASNLQWFTIFSFDNSGYVKDDETLDADALLESLKKTNAAASDERRRLGLPQLTLEGWYVPPHYDQTTNRLEWGTKASSSDGSIVVNYSIRLLGRGGVMSAMLVSSPESFDVDLSAFKRALNGFTFKSGKTYAEFREGDKVAEYGLAALIAGGAAAAAAKSGAGKGLIALAVGALSGAAKFVWIFIVAGIMGVWNFIKGIFSRKENNKS